MNPHDIPIVIEYVKIIIMVVMNTEDAMAILFQSTSFNCAAISIPTITNAAAVTEEVNNDKTVGAKTSESRKKIPINIAVNPVLPPSPIPVALSTYAFNVDVPKTAPMSPLIASARKARSIPSALPSSSMKPH